MAARPRAPAACRIILSATAAIAGTVDMPRLRSALRQPGDPTDPSTARRAISDNGLPSGADIAALATPTATLKAKPRRPRPGPPGLAGWPGAGPSADGYGCCADEDEVGPPPRPRPSSAAASCG